AFDRALELNPDLSDAYYGRAQIRYKRYFQSRLLGSQEDSRQIRARIEKIGAKPEKFHCGRGVLLHLDGKAEEALAELDKAVECNESFADAYAARGAVHLLKGLQGGALDKEALHEALDEFTTASRLTGGATEHRSNRAQVLLALGRKEEALAEANTVVAALPDKPFPYLLRAQILRMMGDEEGYDRDMDKADSLPIENPDMHFSMAGNLIGGAFQSGGVKNLKAKDLQRALKHIDALLEQHPDRTDTRFIRGIALALTGKREEAMADLELYLKEFDDSKLAPVAQLFLSGLKSGGDFSLDSLGLTFQKARETSAAGDEKEAEALFREVLARAGKADSKLVGPDGSPPTRVAAAARIEIARILAKRALRVDSADPSRAKMLDEALDHLENARTAMGDEMREQVKHGDFASLWDHPRFKKIFGIR
ncbi:MAG: tetratricopeptide repeat protein, partial [Planctomycetota bacterium]